MTKVSDKQREVFRWWADPATSGCDGIICDGAVRSGKTMCMSVSFVIWALGSFDRQSFGICGKTIVSLRRNLVSGLLTKLGGFGFQIRENVSKNYVDISLGRITDRFYLFGGKDEGSASLIQGVTLAGILMDETALMPRSFVEQAVARCSVAGSKLWFNCNPDNPYHWFKREWIDKAKQKNLLYLHFELSDNPSLTPEVIARYSRLYSGAFYDRFILGRWTAAEGLIYPMFDEKKYVFSPEEEDEYRRYAVSCDYGTVNPSSFGLWGERDGRWYRIREYYYDSAREGSRRTDEEHYDGLCSLIGETEVDYVVCDPAAASFIQCIMRHGKYPVRPAKNEVVSGIRRVQDMIRDGRIMISSSCTDILREFTLYRWDEGSGRDCPIKEHDHAMDDMRYFVTSLEEDGGGPFTVISVDRR
ncbi:MAG: PBSX family phage terminase large subunit [Ruminococcus sp.]|nr:PBSX family phage terminase large subunit [Ruminococcus sp.]